MRKFYFEKSDQKKVQTCDFESKLGNPISKKRTIPNFTANQFIHAYVKYNINY